MSLRIMYEDDTELAEYEAYSKGYRKDVAVVINKKRYKVYIISMFRLKQDFEIEQQDSGYYMTEPNTIVVKEVTKKEIDFIIKEMYKNNFFKRLDNGGY